MSLKFTATATAIALLTLASAAQAATIARLSAAQVDAFLYVSGFNNAGADKQSEFPINKPGFSEFSDSYNTVLSPAPNSTGIAARDEYVSTVGLTGLSLDLSADMGLALAIANENDSSDWSYSLRVVDTAGEFVDTGNSKLIAQGAAGQFQVLFASNGSFDASSIAQILVSSSISQAELPATNDIDGDTDTTPNWSVRVPAPGTALLLGAVLLGFGARKLGRVK